MVKTNGFAAGDFPLLCTENITVHRAKKAKLHDFTTLINYNNIYIMLQIVRLCPIANIDQILFDVFIINIKLLNKKT